MPAMAAAPPRRPPAAPRPRGGNARVRSLWPDTLFAELTHGEVRVPAVVHTAGGRALGVDPVRWHSLPTEEETALLQRSIGAVLDVGCGPGRHVLALLATGRTALGIDVSPAAIATARRRGAQVTQVSVFGPVPDAGSWDTALLLDGNVGIGGNPRLLLRRLAALLRPGGHVLVELDGSGTEGGRLRIRVEHAGTRTRWFSWATVAVAELGELARTSGYEIAEVWQANNRWFAHLRVRPGSAIRTNRCDTTGAARNSGTTSSAGSG